MGFIDIGIRKYRIPAFGNAVFRISSGLFRGIREDASIGMLEEFSELLLKAEKLINENEICDVFHEKDIKQDIIHGEEFHDGKLQKFYLKETRQYWENRYSIEVLTWMVDFQYFVSEMDGKIGSEWYKLYEIIRGDLPDDFPNGLSFSIMINNVCDRKIDKYINHTVKEYFSKYPNAIDYLRQWKIPDNLPLHPDIGLTVEEFVKQAEKLQTSRLSIMSV